MFGKKWCFSQNPVLLSKFLNNLALIRAQNGTTAIRRRHICRRHIRRRRICRLYESDDPLPPDLSPPNPLPPDLSPPNPSPPPDPSPDDPLPQLVEHFFCQTNCRNCKMYFDVGRRTNFAFLQL
jgi:hypothetical protein